MDQLTYLLSTQRTAELRAEAARARLAHAAGPRTRAWHRTSAALAQRLHAARPTRTTAACATC